MLIPIICIEYIVLKMLTKYNYLTIENGGKLQRLYIKYMFNNFDYEGIITEMFSDANKNKSLEWLLKNVLNSCPNTCLRNQLKHSSDSGELLETSNLGRFYIQDCKFNCERNKYCRLQIRSDLALKAEQLYTSLPVFPILNIKHKDYLQSLGLTICLENFDMKQFYRDLYKFFNDICIKFSLPMIKIKVSNWKIK